MKTISEGCGDILSRIVVAELPPSAIFKLDEDPVPIGTLHLLSIQDISHNVGLLKSTACVLVVVQIPVDLGTKEHSSRSIPGFPPFANDHAIMVRNKALREKLLLLL